jgi:hypothetical protein
VESGARGSGSIVDLGPTLLRLLGLAVPPGLDGQALTWLLRAGPRRGFAAVG